MSVLHDISNALLLFFFFQATVWRQAIPKAMTIALSALAMARSGHDQLMLCAGAEDMQLWRTHYEPFMGQVQLKKMYGKDCGI